MPRIRPGEDRLEPQKMKFIFSKERAGANVSIKLWEELDPTRQNSMLKGTDLEQDEVPVVGLPNGRNPIVITTQRIIWRSTEGLFSIDISAISSVDAPGFGECSKLDLHRLRLKTRDGTEYLLDAMAGKEFFVLWNFALRIIDTSDALPQ